MATWPSRPLFISSTFRDMHAERDHLHRVVFPRLAERLRDRHHHLDPIDLRWGVETSDAAGAEGKELMVLRVCLDEVRRSRPYLLVLLGDRYGWVPEVRRLEEAARLAEYAPADLTGKSVTALEIEYGVLDDGEQQRRSWFYLRKSLPYDEMGAVAGEFSDAHAVDPEAAGRATRLAALKARIRAELPDRVREYEAAWDAAARRVTGLEAWGNQVLEDLWRDLEAETSAWLAQGPQSWQDEERRSIEDFVESRSRDFCGREELLRDLHAFATGDDGPERLWGMLVAGEPGAGKSAIFAQVVRRLQAEPDVRALLHAAGISPRSTSVFDMLRRWVGELAAARGATDPTNETSSLEDLQAALRAELVRAGSTGTRVVLAVDALNELERSPAAMHVQWLPLPMPRNVRLLMTAVRGSETEALAEHEGIDARWAPPLADTEAAAIVATICARYRKTLPQPALDALLAARLPDGGAAAGNPLWLRLAVGELLSLDADDFSRARQFAGSEEERLRQLLRDRAAELPPDVPALYGTLLDRVEDTHGRDWVRTLLSVIALGRGGWRDRDLQALLPLLTGLPWDELRFADVRRMLHGHLVQRGADARRDFFHAQLRSAVPDRNLPNPADRRALHARLGDYLETLPPDDPLRHSELMVHYIAADDKARAAAHMGSELPEPAVKGAIEALADHIARHGDAGAQWVAGLVGEAGLGEQEARRLCVRYQFDLDERMARGSRLAWRLIVQQAAADWLQQRHDRNPHSSQAARDLSVSLNNLGDLHLRLGDTASARGYYERCLEILEALHRADPQSSLAARDLSVSLNKLGDLHLRLNDTASARGYYERSLELDEFQYATHRTGEAASELALSLCSLGDLHLRLDDMEAAMQCFERSLHIRQTVYAGDCGNGSAMLALADTWSRLGDLQLRMGYAERAQSYYRRSLKVAEEHYAASRQEPMALRNLSATLTKLGDSNLISGDAEAALHYYTGSLKLDERLYAADSRDHMAARDLSISLEKIGDLLAQAGDAASALSHYERSLAISEAIFAEYPRDSQNSHDLCLGLQRLGIMYEQVGKPEAARHSYRRSVQVAEARYSADPQDGQASRDLAVSLNLLGDLQVSGGDGAEARLFYLRGLGIFETLYGVARDSQAARDLATSFGRLAEVQVRDGDLPGVRALLPKVRQLLDDVASGRVALDDEVLAYLNERVAGAVKLLAG